MPDYYEKNYKEYHEKTFIVDPSSFLSPFAKNLEPGSIILDIGCGSGRDLLWLKKRGFKVVGFERSPGLAGLVRENVRCEVIKDDFEAYDFSPLSVDAILLVGTFVHLPHRKLPDVVNSIGQALKDDGKMLLSLKRGAGSTTDSHGREFHLWSDAELRGIFKNQGLDVILFFEQESKIGTDEVWLGYVLTKAGH